MELNGIFFGPRIQTGTVAVLGNLLMLSPNKDGKMIGICGEKKKEPLRKTFLIPEPSLNEPPAPHTWEPPGLRLKF